MTVKDCVAEHDFFGPSWLRQHERLGSAILTWRLFGMSRGPNLVLAVDGVGMLGPVGMRPASERAAWMRVFRLSVAVARPPTSALGTR